MAVQIEQTDKGLVPEGTNKSQGMSEKEGSGTAPVTNESFTEVPKKSIGDAKGLAKRQFITAKIQGGGISRRD